MAGTIPLLTFREKVAPILRLCHTILAKHGEPCRPEERVQAGFSYRGGYRFAAHVNAGSEPDYALRILWTLNIALASTDLDEARKYAWDAGQLIFDAHVTFKGKKTALHAAFLAGQTHTANALERDVEVATWQAEIDQRPAWKSRATVIAAIAEREGIRSDSVGKRLRRTARRQQQARPARNRGQHRR